mmetsp:Transcript_10847/g.15887  ORF Transcript_10847/g.15887 Transcript_10847/m.15887 type:complete len:1130 (+) Transcript_10847:99-3488(+)
MDQKKKQEEERDQPQENQEKDPSKEIKEDVKEKKEKSLKKLPEPLKKSIENFNRPKIRPLRKRPLPGGLKSDIENYNLKRSTLPNMRTRPILSKALQEAIKNQDRLQEATTNNEKKALSKALQEDIKKAKKRSTHGEMKSPLNEALKKSILSHRRPASAIVRKPLHHSLKNAIESFDQEQLTNVETIFKSPEITLQTETIETKDQLQADENQKEDTRHLPLPLQHDIEEAASHWHSDKEPAKKPLPPSLQADIENYRRKTTSGVVRKKPLTPALKEAIENRQTPSSPPLFKKPLSPALKAAIENQQTPSSPIKSPLSPALKAAIENHKPPSPVFKKPLSPALKEAIENQKRVSLSLKKPLSAALISDIENTKRSSLVMKKPLSAALMEDIEKQAPKDKVSYKKPLPLNLKNAIENVDASSHLNKVTESAVVHEDDDDDEEEEEVLVNEGIDEDDVVFESTTEPIRIPEHPSLPCGAKLYHAINHPYVAIKPFDLDEFKKRSTAYTEAATGVSKDIELEALHTLNRYVDNLEDIPGMLSLDGHKDISVLSILRSCLALTQGYESNKVNGGLYEKCSFWIYGILLMMVPLEQNIKWEKGKRHSSSIIENVVSYGRGVFDSLLCWLEQDKTSLSCRSDRDRLVERTTLYNSLGMYAILMCSARLDADHDIPYISIKNGGFKEHADSLSLESFYSCAGKRFGSFEQNMQRLIWATGSYKEANANVENFSGLVKFGFHCSLNVLSRKKNARNAASYFSTPKVEAGIRLWNLMDNPLVQPWQHMYFSVFGQSIPSENWHAIMETPHTPITFSKLETQPSQLINQKDSLPRTLSDVEFHSAWEKIKSKYPKIQKLVPTLTFRVISKYKPASSTLSTFKVISKKSKKCSEKKVSILFHIHGGGFVAMKTKSHEPYLRVWSQQTGVVMVSYEYPLATSEQPFPFQTLSCYAAYRYVAEHPEEFLPKGTTLDKLLIGGDSAGGNLSLSVMLCCVADKYRMPDGALLTYPAANVSDSPSLARLCSLVDPMVNFGFLNVCNQVYVPKTNNAYLNPFLSPVCAPSSALSQFPPCLVNVGTMDPLYDESICMAKRIARNNGGAVQLDIYDRFPHGYLNMVQLSNDAKKAVLQCGDWLKSIVSY